MEQPTQPAVTQQNVEPQLDPQVKQQLKKHRDRPKLWKAILSIIVVTILIGGVFVLAEYLKKRGL